MNSHEMISDYASALSNADKEMLIRLILGLTFVDSQQTSMKNIMRNMSMLDKIS